MGMSLHEIEEKAQELAGYLLVAGKQEALLLGIQIEGLRDLAQIMSTVAYRKERESVPPATAVQLPVYPAPMAAPIPALPCPSTLSLGEKEHYVCTRPTSHDGPHIGGGMTWTGPGNTGFAALVDPIKPAVDQLHELLSYLINQSERELVRSQSDGKSPDEASRHLGESKAYDDAATKLQEILQEGGI